LLEDVATTNATATTRDARGAGARTTLDGLRALDAAWAKMRRGDATATATATAAFAKRREGASDARGETYDVAVAGGTLGVLVAAALQRRGARVVVVERGELRGREQEWNVSREELERLVRVGAITTEDADACTRIEFNPIRCGFHGGGNGNGNAGDLVTRDILNTGVSPAALVEACRKRFEEAGGAVLERASLRGVEVYDDCAVLDVDGAPVRARLVLDCMGFQSPIVRQIRDDRKPDGVCVVVGSCAEADAFDNSSADLIRTVTDIEEDYRGQYFWEAFPASTGPRDRTTYMFTYMDADESRPSIASMLDDYWDLMPLYQGLDSIEDAKLKRVLFGLFPTYRDSPLKTEFDRVLAIGDASGIQSPLSFGGLAAILRHISRITGACEEALDADCLDREALRTVNAYQPALSAAWLFQKCMSVEVGSRPKRDFINRLMRINFNVMSRLGEDVLRPFLQDVVTFKGLGKTLVSMTLTEPLFVPEILMNAGVGPILDWFKHFAALGAYDFLASPAAALADTVKDFSAVSPRRRFIIRRQCEAIIYGAGRDVIP
jgi:flavin-dependent dehydrogenase